MIAKYNRKNTELWVIVQVLAPDMTLISYMSVVDFWVFCLPLSISPSFSSSTQILLWGTISSPELRLWALDRAHCTPCSKERYVIHILLTKVLYSDQGDWLRNGINPSLDLWLWFYIRFLEKISIFFILDMNLEGYKTGVFRSFAWV